MSNNLQMIHENAEGEVHTMNDHMGMEGAPGINGTQVQEIENNINLYQQNQQDQMGAEPNERMPLEYENEEDEIVCGRFPHLDVCVCDISCEHALKEINLFQVYPGIYMGPYQSAFKTQDLIEKGVNHILNASCKEYTKRSKYFKYLDINITDEVGENAQRFYRITNRFIDEALKSGSILVHSVQGKSRAPTFIMAYLIHKEKMKLKDGLALLREYVAEVEPNESFF
jgi:protein-tyrosine phosphatase